MKISNIYKPMSLLVALLVAATAAAQAPAPRLPEKIKVYAPEEVLNLTLTQKDADRIAREKKGGKSGKPWPAMSDRAGNATYTDPRSGAPVVTRLNFGQQVWIADISNGYALVFKAANVDSSGKIAAQAESLGWIPMDNLLLWRTSPVDERGIYQKALLTVNLDQLASEEQFNQDKSNLFRLTLTPSAHASDQNNVTSQHIYYVMKRQGNYALLAGEYRSDANAGSTLQGWTPISGFSAWNQRSCLEPTWDKDDLTMYLQGKSVKSYKEAQLKTFLSQWDFEPDDSERLAGSILRFPILNNDSRRDDIYRATFFSSANKTKGAGGNSKRTKDDILDDAIREMSNVNFIIVIDGTTSMKPFYAEIKNAIQEGLKFYNNNYKMKVGVVIYRDLADGPSAYEVLPLTSPNDPALARFLDEGGKYGVGSSPRDHTMEEDMFLGLEKALDTQLMGYSPRHSNIMLLVGDCGNTPDEKRLADIIDKMARNRIQLMVYQTNYDTGSGSYQWFRSQAQTMLKRNFDEQFRVIGAKPGRFAEIKGGIGRNYQRGEAELQSGANLYMGALRYPAKPGSLPYGELRTIVADNLKEYADVVTARVQAVTDATTNLLSAEGRTGTFNQDFVVGLIGADNAKAIMESNALVAVTGYSPKQASNGTAYWKPVIFISTDEFNNLLQRLKPAYEVARRRLDDRKPYVEALEGIIKAMDPSAQTGNTDIGAITALLAGLNVQTEATTMQGITINDIMEPKAVSPAKYRSILDTFKRKYEKLHGYQRSYQWKRQFGQATYYWIPVEDLP